MAFVWYNHEITQKHSLCTLRRSFLPFFLFFFPKLCLSPCFFVISFTSKIKGDIFQIALPAVRHSIIIFYGAEAHFDDICAHPFLIPLTQYISSSVCTATLLHGAEDNFS